MIVVVMGVSGSGKTTLGIALAAALGWPFVEADDLHPPANVAKMAAGTPLDDDDRWPWLDRVVAALREALQRNANVVLACSALKQAYRDRLRLAGPACFVHLRGRQSMIAERLATRRHRYMPATLLASQFAALEPPLDAIVVDVESDTATQVRNILDALPRSANGGTPLDEAASPDPSTLQRKSAAFPRDE
jgi:gluconokinase